jgi:N-acetylmuramoyl-L-alanine amidase
VRRGSRVRTLPLVALGALVGVGSLPLAGQEALELGGVAGPGASVPVLRHHGYAAIPADGLEAVGWRVGRTDRVWHVDLPGQSVQVTVEPGSPFLDWNGTLVQLTAVPYEVEGRLHLPLQFATDVVPDRLPARFRAEGPARLIVVGEAGPLRSVAEPSTFVVVIDPGHGGEDPGAMGPGGTREKDVALALARVLADSLRTRSGFEVHLTRDRDELVPIWQRGEIATRVKGDRPGVFVSIHANGLAARDVRGVETYFLSEARTEHERRVAALENAPLALERPGLIHEDPGLGFILNELRNHDHQHWSADLAAVVQRNLAAVHPGPNRGVKQAPLAVITNALMPAVLLEIGFITHREEERALASPAFHARAAGALVRAIEEFAGRYPPGRSASTGGAR